MATSSAERQKRYRQRLKALAANGSNAVHKLNEIYNSAAAEQRDNALREIRKKVARARDETLVLAVEEMITRLPPPSYEWTLEDWCRIAELLGQKDEQDYIAETQKLTLRKTRNEPRRPWAPFRNVAREQPTPEGESE